MYLHELVHKGALLDDVLAHAGVLGEHDEESAQVHEDARLTRLIGLEERLQGGERVRRLEYALDGVRVLGQIGEHAHDHLFMVRIETCFIEYRTFFLKLKARNTL